MPRAEFTVKVEFTISMDDTTPREALETVSARINEMLATLERRDDVRIVLLNTMRVDARP